MTSHSDGYIVTGSLARYTPFGDWRTEPGADLTDRGFTGHMSNNTGNNDLGLIYMNARFYVPSLNRFASADTIVPDPMNPQSLNRYTYVLNSPINFADPSGHLEECGLLGGGHDTLGCTIAPADVYGEEVYLYSANYGYIDVRHLLTEIGRTDSVLAQIETNPEEIRLAGNCGPGFDVCGIAQYFQVDDDIPDKEVAPTTLGIIMNYEKRYERYQGLKPFKPTSFAAEDLPSDYIGAVARLRADDIPGATTEAIDILLDLGITAPRDDVTQPTNFLGFRKRNHEFHPLDVDWPEWLQHDSNSRWSRYWSYQGTRYCYDSLGDCG
ncbi:MAG: RHS repeat-associated core domain-containing protein [Anaerolineales bacterium]|nr:RHS repeat-associated core domain-containing protein [Anaerolineales bacterium]